MKTKIVNYGNIKKNIKDGDILLYKGTALPSRIIRMVTKSEYSHAGIAAKWNNRHMVMEVTHKGVIATTLARNIRHYKGDVEWFSSKKDISKAKRDTMIKFAQEQLGNEYDFLQLLRIGIKLLFKKVINVKDERLICSEFVAEMYSQVGIDLKKGASDAFTTPSDISRSAMLERKFILKHLK